MQYTDIFFTLNTDFKFQNFLCVRIVIINYYVVGNVVESLVRLEIMVKINLTNTLTKNHLRKIYIYLNL